jgi:hypothetical protein
MMAVSLGKALAWGLFRKGSQRLITPQGLYIAGAYQTGQESAQQFLAAGK